MGQGFVTLLRERRVTGKPPDHEKQFRGLPDPSACVLPRAAPGSTNLIVMTPEQQVSQP